MRGVVLSKFTQNADLKEKLLATGKRYLEETNWWNDVTWGVCKEVGQNLLGEILMDTRAHLNGETSLTLIKD
jgi:predicted NAD-dependent protein-ADP-ribosyltransferase YbiA (DUF1768 family)